MVEVLKVTSQDKAYGIVYKFRVDDNRYRISKDERGYLFEHSLSGHRCYTAHCYFDNFEDAKNFIYTSECP